MTKTTKSYIRLLLITYTLYLCNMVVSTEYLIKIKDLDPNLLQVIVGSPFVALGAIIKFHFETSPTE